VVTTGATEDAAGRSVIAFQKRACIAGRGTRAYQTFGSRVIFVTVAGSFPLARSATVTFSRIERRLARSATHTSRRGLAESGYSIAGGRTPRTVASAVGPALRLDDLGALQLEQDVLEKREGDVLRVGDLLALDRARVGARQLEHRPDRVVLLRRDPHEAILPDRAHAPEPALLLRRGPPDRAARARRSPGRRGAAGRRRCRRCDERLVARAFPIGPPAQAVTTV
jgi:hypothetical protein